MTQTIQATLARTLAGEGIDPTDPALPELMAEMRAAVRDPKALRQIGMDTVSLLNAHLRSVVLTAKAVHVAKGGDHG